MTPAEQYFNFLIIRQVELQRVATWMLYDLIDQLMQLEGDIISEVIAIDPTGTLRATYRAGRQQKLLDAIRARLKEIYQEIESRVTDHFQEAGDLEEESQRKAFLSIWGMDFSPIQFSAKALLILGASIKDHIRKIRDDAYFRLAGVIKNGTINGTPAETMAGIIKGRTDPPTSPEIQKEARALEVVIRTGADQVSNDITTDLVEEQTEPTMKQGSKFGPHGWQQISILDNRTTQICRDYAYRIWDANYKPVGHNLPFDGGPPRHMYCRSRIRFVYLDDEDLPNRQTFEQWLKKQNGQTQEAIFGVKKMQLYRRGKLSETDLIRQGDRQLSLEDFRKLVDSEG